MGEHVHWTDMTVDMQKNAVRGPALPLRPNMEELMLALSPYGLQGQWCQDNLSGRWSYRAWVYYFEDENDAFMFKLKVGSHQAAP